MTYSELLAAQPPPRLHGNFTLAQEFVTLVTDALHDTTQPWTPAQRAYLYRLYRKWWRRASGQDLRWNLAPPRPGRPAKHPGKTRRASTARKAWDADMEDPLVRRIIEKFGTPKGGRSL